MKYKENYFMDLRARLFLTQEEASKESGLTIKTIRNIEKGKETVKNENFKKLEDFYLNSKILKRPLESKYPKLEENQNIKIDSFIDYISIHLPINDIDFIFNKILGINYENFIKEDDFFIEKKVNFFDGQYKFNNIYINVSSKSKLQGSQIILTGKGMNTFDFYLFQQGRTWTDFFNDVFKYNGNFTRVDLTIDDYKEFVSLEELLTKIAHHDFYSSIMVKEYNGTFDLEKNGITLTFGSRQSETFIRLYQKNYEESHKLNIDINEIDVKNRYEIELKGFKANNVIEQLINKNTLINRLDILKIVSSILKRYIIFYNKNSKETFKKWDNLLINAGKFEFDSPTKKEFSEEEQFEIKLTMLSKSYAKWFLSDLINGESSFFNTVNEKLSLINRELIRDNSRTIIPDTFLESKKFYNFNFIKNINLKNMFSIEIFENFENVNELKSFLTIIDIFKRDIEFYKINFTFINDFYGYRIYLYIFDGLKRFKEEDWNLIKDMIKSHKSYLFF